MYVDVNLKLTHDEAHELFIEGLNEIIADEGKEDELVAVEADEVPNKKTLKTHEISDEDMASVITIAIAKRLNFKLTEKEDEED